MGKLMQVAKQALVEAAAAKHAGRELTRQAIDQLAKEMEDYIATKAPGTKGEESQKRAQDILGAFIAKRRRAANEHAVDGTACG